jgi:outer membrane protein OmpA-like peptidoglycan-associated protein
VLVPLRNAEGNYRLHAVASYRVPPAASTPAPPVLPAAMAARDASAAEAASVVAGRPAEAPAAVAPVAAAPPSPAAVAGTAEAVPPEDFPDLLFAINTTWLSRPSRETLDRVAEALARNPDRRVVLSGHTDGAGDPELNRALSRERAARAGRYLRARGIEAGRIEVRAFGAKQPVETAGPSEFRPRNRRVEITVQ